MKGTGLHELSRLYGEELLASRGEDDAARKNHFDYYLETAESRRPDAGAASSFESFHWLVREQPYLSAALSRARVHEPDVAERLAQCMQADLHGFGVHLWGGEAT